MSNTSFTNIQRSSQFEGALLKAVEDFPFSPTVIAGADTTTTGTTAVEIDVSGTATGIVLSAGKRLVGIHYDASAVSYGDSGGNLIFETWDGSAATAFDTIPIASDSSGAEAGFTAGVTAGASDLTLRVKLSTATELTNGAITSIRALIA